MKSYSPNFGEQTLEMQDVSELQRIQIESWKSACIANHLKCLSSLIINLKVPLECF